MEITAERITAENRQLFDAMVLRREGRSPLLPPPSEEPAVLSDKNLYVYAARLSGEYVGWISLVYIPKLGPRWNDRGHVYVDELWVEPGHRRKGVAKALMAKADALCRKLNAHGIRLYVNTENPGALELYRQCGFEEDGRAIFMEKKL